MAIIYPMTLCFGGPAINCSAIDALPVERTEGEQVRFALGPRSGIWARKER